MQKRVKKSVLISCKDKLIQVAVLERGRLEDYFVETKEEKTLVGNIYKGVVEDIKPSVGACFVNVGLARKGFLYLSDLNQILKIEEEAEEESWFRKLFFPRRKLRNSAITKGKEILVQVIKDPYERKGSRLTSHITLASRTLVFIYGSHHFGVSKKIEDLSERSRLKNIIRKLPLPENCGLIARTFSEGQDRKKIIADYKYLLNLWRLIKHRSSRLKAPSLVYEEYDLVLRVVRDYISSDISEIYIDSLEDFKRIKKFSQTFFPEFQKRIFYYERPYPLFEFFGVSNQMKEVFSRRIRLECGGYIIIEKTQALTSIDVNSGSFKTNLSQEEASFLVNKEAAKEIARQLRLRDIGGIVVIDFIDMHNRLHRDKLLNILRSYLNQDRAKTEIVSYSPIGLVEMTRRRTRKGPETIFLQDCPYCEGSGKVRSLYAIGMDLVSKLRDYISAKNSSRVSIRVNPRIKEYIEKQWKSELLNIEKKYSSRVYLEPDENLPFEKYILR